MAGLSLRDRFFTPPVARAVTSPGAILAIGAGAGIGILTGGGILAAVVLGAVGFGARVAAAIPRRTRGTRIDPFTLSEPWRHFVTDALQARTRFHEAVDAALSGPMRDRLQSIQERVDAGVEDVWRIARRGDALVAARRQVDPDAIRAEIEQTRANADQPWVTGSTLERTMESLSAQLATADRLDRVIVDAVGQLRLLNARLDEAAARTIELSVQSGDVSALGGLDDDVDQMVDEMEALRQAIEETGRPVAGCRHRVSDLDATLEAPLPEVESHSASGAEATTDGRTGSYLVAAGILLSRIAGLVREIAISAYLGVGATVDVFKAAARIPNLLQNLLGEGVLSASFIPVYARLLEEDRRKANLLAGKILGLLLALMAAIVAVGVLAARPLTLIITPGFEGEQLELATTLLRIMFPGVAFLVLSAFCTGILNSHRRFFLSYVSPVMWNATQIAFVVAAGVYGATDVGIAHALAWGVLIGAVLEVLIQVPSVRRLTSGARLSLDHRSPEVREVIHRFTPVVFGRGVIQILTYVELFLASLLAVGAVSALTFGQVLYLLPISLFGMAVAAAELPELARIGRSGRAAIKARLHEGLERITFYVSITVALYVFAGDVIVRVLFQRGEFTAADTRLVWFVTAAFALGLLGTTRSRLLQNGLFALDRTTLVARIAVVRVALAALIGGLLMFPLDRYAIVGSSIEKVAPIALRPLPDSLRLVDDGSPHLGIVGLALGAAVSSWIEYRLLKGALRWRIGALPPMDLAGRWCLLAAVGVGILAAGLRSVTDHLPSIAALVLVVGPSVVTYLLITWIVRVPEAVAIVSRVRGLVPFGQGEDRR